MSEGGACVDTDAWVDQHHHIHSIGGPHPGRSLHPGVLWHRLRRRQPLSGIAGMDRLSQPPWLEVQVLETPRNAAAEAQE